MCQYAHVCAVFHEYYDLNGILAEKSNEFSHVVEYVLTFFVKLITGLR